ncbi:hypothetical protein J6590_006717 [Homalodisca vitripennis]|nr:hypothetical protein J6590_006717 [Homalodisca vitripennis]
MPRRSTPAPGRDATHDLGPVVYFQFQIRSWKSGLRGVVRNEDQITYRTRGPVCVHSLSTTLAVAEAVEVECVGEAHHAKKYRPFFVPHFIHGTSLPHCSISITLPQLNFEVPKRIITGESNGFTLNTLSSVHNAKDRQFT